ncbi:helix-turn-helix transcriptional regulator [Yinghuangia seranimata]|uniref:helix-turn-helix transcriptional regulator n=1 Tax=Yinghuangia seranimata TaxID=408067 RepID=UPI00248B61D8|nr:helix-turn-helix transcriptional regulator [Yinghuangia seranimata]MDI2126495.1 helix-turn-helix transcriptional regulator [Yinghuangia seranimata]
MNDAFDDLGDFLRSRRSRLQPEDVGLPDFGRRRRVPGLRREEVAQLAGVSVDYYIRLEQGRGQSVSDSVLDAVARVLRLNPTEHEHLRTLARPARAAERAGRSGSRQVVRPEVQALLDLMAAPAFLLGRCMDVLAWNALGDALYGFASFPPGERNMARHAFLDPDGSAIYAEWESVVSETVAYLRLDAARHPGDPRIASFIDELSDRSPEFRRLWAEYDVKEKTFGVKRINHPVAGPLELAYETLALPGDADQLVVSFQPVPSSPYVGNLALLGAGVSSAQALVDA